MFTDFALINDGIERMHDQPDGIGNGEHPNPAIEWLIPNEEFLNILVNDDIDGVINRGVLIDRADRVVDGHAIVCSVVVKNLCY